LHARSLDMHERVALHVTRALVASHAYGALNSLASVKRGLSRSTRHS
jgi:hypothetical protein